jgi:hypothetical protein
MPSSQIVVFGESKAGIATPIDAWFPSDSIDGYQFVYPRAQ